MEEPGLKGELHGGLGRLRFAAVAMAMALGGLVACAHPVRDSGRCAVAGSAGGLVQFVGEVIAVEQDALHMDFDDFGADFAEVRLHLSAPVEWRGYPVSAFADLNDQEVSDLLRQRNVAFVSDVHSCEQRVWLFVNPDQLLRPATPP
jgi:hypothetical protein